MDQLDYWKTLISSDLLIEQFPNLYNFVIKWHDTLATMMGHMPLNISFHRTLAGDTLIY
jgi:hypothetical protein